MKLKFAVIFAVPLLLSACTTKFAYNYLDWIIEWYAGKYVTLSDDQQWVLNNAIDSELKWHRKTQLPFYVNTLDQILKDIEGEITLVNLKKLYNDNELLWKEVKAHSAPQIAELLLNLKNKQVKELFENIEVQNRELEQEYVLKKPRKLIEQRAERMIDRLEDWVDELNKKQVKLVYEWAERFYPLSDRWIMSRRAWLNEFRAAFDLRKQPEAFKSRVTNLLQDSRQFWTVEHSEIFQANVELTLAMIAELHSMLTEDQREYLQQEISNLRTQLDELSREA